MFVDKEWEKDEYMKFNGSFRFNQSRMRSFCAVYQTRIRIWIRIESYRIYSVTVYISMANTNLLYALNIAKQYKRMF